MNDKILIVDDDASTRQFLKRLLELEHYRVILARNGQEAVEMFESQRPALVVLDLHLGGEDGWKVFKTLAKLDPRVPVVVTTGKRAQRAKAVKAGAEALIEKPFEMAALLGLVEQLLAETRRSPLQRRFGDEQYCRYVSRHYDLCLTNMPERHSTPLMLEEEFVRRRRIDLKRARARKKPLPQKQGLKSKPTKVR